MGDTNRFVGTCSGLYMVSWLKNLWWLHVLFLWWLGWLILCLTIWGATSSRLLQPFKVFQKVWFYTVFGFLDSIIWRIQPGRTRLTTYQAHYQFCQLNNMGTKSWIISVGLLEQNDFQSSLLLNSLRTN